VGCEKVRREKCADGLQQEVRNVKKVRIVRDVGLWILESRACSGRDSCSGTSQHSTKGMVGKFFG